MKLGTKYHEKKVHRGEYGSLRGIIDLILELPEELRGQPMIEVGSFIGESTTLFSMFFSPVFAVDPFYGCPEAGLPGDQVKKRYYKTIENRNIVTLEMKSTEAVTNLPFVNFVYIDACHDYKSVKEDIEAYWPKIRTGGYIAGHDYGLRVPGNDGVQSVVDELFGSPDVLFCDTSWLIKKTDGRKKE